MTDNEEEKEEEFELIDKSKGAKLVVCYEDGTITDLKNQIKKLNDKIDRVHYINTIARVGWVLVNPSFHLQNFSKDLLYRSAAFMARQFLG